MTKVDLIMGFLGAGKTKFIKRYMQYLARQDITVTVIENEYGASPVDFEELQDDGASVQDLSGGCVCCTLTPKFMDMLEMLSDKYDRIIFEPSGVFMPADIVRIIETYKEKGVCELGMCITVIDPASFSDLDETMLDMVGNLVANANALLWSKTDTPAVQDKNAAARLMETLVPGFSQRFYPHATWECDDNDFELLMDASRVSVVSPVSTFYHPSDIESFSVRVKDEIDLEGFRRLMEEIVSDDSYGVIFRIKGALYSNGNVTALNYALGQRVTLENCSSTTPTRLNFIGRHMETRKISSAIKEFEKLQPLYKLA